MHENPTAASQGRTRCIWAKTPIHVLRKPRPAIWKKELNNLGNKSLKKLEITVFKVYPLFLTSDRKSSAMEELK